jgi:hypothetical protein
MRLEQIPLFLGIVVAILGLGLVLDAQLPAVMGPARERRRRARAPLHKGGETLVGLGILALAAALMGRDTWRFGTVSVLIGVGLLVAGGWFNRDYLRELFAFRGPARRGEKRSAPRATTAPRGLADTPPVRPEAMQLADSPPRRDPRIVRADREAPIMKATDGSSGPTAPLGEDTPPDGHPRLPAH